MISLVSPAHAADAFRVITAVPGPVDINQYGILGFIQNGYLLALGAASILAVASIVYGAVEYTASRGNPGKLADAWDRIVQALIGLLLLVGAATLLGIINPGLNYLELPRIRDSKVESSFGGYSIKDMRAGFTDQQVQQIGGADNIPGLICNAANAYYGTDTSSGPGGGRQACAWSVSNIMKNAGLIPVGNTVRGMESIFRGGRGQEISQSDAKCGDIVAVTGSRSNHTGICLNQGCTSVISNSSGQKKFVWRSAPDFYFNGGPYPRGGPYRIYRVLK